MKKGILPYKAAYNIPQKSNNNVQEQEPLEELINKYSQVNSGITEIWGLRWMKNVYSQSFHDRLQEDLHTFNQMEDTELKNRLSSRIQHCIAQIVAYEAWETVLDEQLDGVLKISSIFPIVLLIDVFILFHPNGWGWLIAILAAIITLVVGMWIFNVLDKLFYSFTSSIIYYLLSGLFFFALAYWLHQLTPLPFFLEPVRQGIMNVAIAFVPFCAGLLISFVIRVSAHTLILQRKIQQHPQEEIVARINCYMGKVRNWPDEPPNIASINEFVQGIEWIADLIEGKLSDTFLINVKDDILRLRLSERARHMAWGFRQILQFVLMPQDSEIREECADYIAGSSVKVLILKALSQKLNYAATCQWGQFVPEREPPQRLPPKVQVWSLFRMFLAIIFPLLIAGGFWLIRVNLSVQERTTIIVGMFGWFVVNLSSVILPQSVQNLGSSKTIFDYLQSKTSSGGSSGGIKS